MDPISSPTSNPFITPSRVVYATPGLGQFLYLLRTVGRSLKYFIDSLECKISNATSKKTGPTERLFVSVDPNQSEIPSKFGEISNLRKARVSQPPRMHAPSGSGELPLLNPREIIQAERYLIFVSPPDNEDNTDAKNCSVQVGQKKHAIIPKSLEPFHTNSDIGSVFRRGLTGMEAGIHYDKDKREVVVGFHGWDPDNWGSGKQLFAIIKNLFGIAPGVFEDASLLVGDMKKQVEFLNSKILEDHLDAELNHFAEENNLNSMEVASVRSVMLGELSEDFLPKQLRNKEKITAIRQMNQRVLQKTQKDEIKLTVTGHSFGGALASYASLKNGVRGFVYNPLALGVGARKEIGAHRLDEARHFLTEVVVPGDWVADRPEANAQIEPLTKAFINVQNFNSKMFRLGPKRGPLGTARRFGLISGGDLNRKHNLTPQHFQEHFEISSLARVHDLLPEGEKDPVETAHGIVNDVLEQAKVQIYDKQAKVTSIFSYDEAKFREGSQKGTVRRVLTQLREAREKSPGEIPLKHWDAVIADLEDYLELFDNHLLYSSIPNLLQQFPDRKMAGSFVDSVLKDLGSKYPPNYPANADSLFVERKACNPIHRKFLEDVLNGLGKIETHENETLKNQLTALIQDIETYLKDYPI